MITLTFRGSADTTQQPQTKVWQETYPESGDDEELIRINHKRSVNSRIWDPPGVVVLDEEVIKKSTSANACKAKELPTAHTPVNKDTFQKVDK